MSKYAKHKFHPFRQITALIAGFAFFFNSIVLVDAQSSFVLPAVGSQVTLSPVFHPAMLKAIKVHPDNPFEFDFIIDQGEENFSLKDFKGESQKLIRYFLASLTTPENEMWVNLSPYEKNRIIPESFGVTEMGRDLLAQDYLLKQITATLMYPEGEIGKKFWDTVRQKAFKKFGTSEVSTDTFNKVWIVPQQAVVYENGATAYVDKTRLKVMLEEDYVALANQKASAESSATAQTNSIGSQVIREIVLPELEKEVNEGTHFAQLRQIYNSLILANWYKKRVKDSILAKVYVDQNKVAGVEIDDKAEAQKIYEQYIAAFKQGVYNYIKEDIDPLTQESIPRKYFSGGVALMGMVGSSAIMVLRTGDPVNVPEMSNIRRIHARFVGSQRGAVDVSSGWAMYRRSDPRISGDLAYRLARLNNKFVLPRANEEGMIVKPVGSTSRMRTIDTDEVPLDLLKEISYYLQDLEEQMKAEQQRINIPTLYEKTKEIFRKIMVVAFVMNRSTLQILESSLSRDDSADFTAFMDGDNDALNADQVRRIVQTIIDAGIEVPDDIVILLREPTLLDMRNDAVSVIMPVILSVAQAKNIPMSPQTAKRLAQVASRGETELLNNALSRRSLTWSEILEKDDKIYPVVERAAALENQIDDDINRLGNTLVRIREQVALSQEEVARRSGVSLEIYQYYERGEIRRVNPRHILTFAKVLGVDIDELWPADDIIQFTFHGSFGQVAASAVALPEDVRNYSSLKPEEKEKVKAKYRTPDGYYAIPFEGLWEQREMLGGVNLYALFDQDPVIFYDPMLDQPQYSHIKELILRHNQFVIDQWEAKRREFGYSAQEMLSWIRNNYNPDWLFSRQSLAEVFDSQEAQQKIQNLISIGVLRVVSDDSLRLWSIELDRAAEFIQTAVGRDYFVKVMRFFKEIQEEGAAGKLSAEFSDPKREGSGIEALREFRAIQNRSTYPLQDQDQSQAQSSSPVGGIDLSAKQLMLDIRSENAPVKFNFNQKEFEAMQFDGFVSVIINISPVKNLPLFLTQNNNSAADPS